MKLTLKQWNCIVDILEQKAKQYESVAIYIDKNSRKNDWEFVSKDAEELYKENRDKANEITRMLDSINEQLI